MPSLHDQASDLERLNRTLGIELKPENTRVLTSMTSVLEKSNYKTTAVYHEKKLIGLEPRDTSSLNYGIAVDIGTTTVAAYLYDLNSGKRLDVASMLNPQKQFGADVISRIEFAMSSEENLEIINAAVVECLNKLAAQLADHAGIEPSSIYEMTVVGNTTMLSCSSIESLPSLGDMKIVCLSAYKLTGMPFLVMTKRITSKYPCKHSSLVRMKGDIFSR